MASGIDTRMVRIMVVGVPRSGTTLVQAMLATHSALTSFTESHFFSRHFRLIPISSTPILASDPAPRVREFLVENGLDEPTRNAIMAEEETELSPPFLLMPWRTRSVACHLLEVLDRVAVSRGYTRWIEKTAQHLRYIPFIESLHPRDPECRTHFVHVVRDGLEAVASLHVASRSWSSHGYPFALGPVPPYDLKTCAERWNADVAFSLGRIDSPVDHFVCYEDLTEHPEPTLKRLLRELDLGWEPRILEDYADTASALVTSSETWKRVNRQVLPSRTSDHSLNAEQREQVGRLLRRDLYAQIHERAARESVA